MLRAVRALPPEAEGTWDEQREAFGDAVVNAIAEYAPNIKDLDPPPAGADALDIERTFGLTEGNIFQGELTLEQLFFLRPVPGWAQYATPVTELYMCGSATHPGGGIMGAPGKNAAERILKDAAAMSAPVVVIGGGVNGLVCAALAGPRRPPVRSCSSGVTRSAAARRTARDCARVPRAGSGARGAAARRRGRATLDLEAHGLAFIAGESGIDRARRPRPRPDVYEDTGARPRRLRGVLGRGMPSAGRDSCIRRQRSAA